MLDRLQKIRQAEAESHTEAYKENNLFAAGSWLAKPVKTVLDLFPLFDGYREIHVLDLGCGVGRNCIPAAKAFSRVSCRVDCVDILDFAIEKLLDNAEKFGVSDQICGVVSSIDDYEIQDSSYDLIMAISALEHVDSEKTFRKKLGEIYDGLRSEGIACLIVNSGIRERDKVSGAELLPQFEVNMSTETLRAALEHTFSGCEIIKHTVVHQKYDIPREGGMSELDADVVTWVVRKGNHG